MDESFDLVSGPPVKVCIDLALYGLVLNLIHSEAVLYAKEV